MAKTEGTFTMATGLGMLGVGMVVILIAGLIILKVINTIAEKDKEDQEQREREKVYGSK